MRINIILATLNLTLLTTFPPIFVHGRALTSTSTSKSTWGVVERDGNVYGGMEVVRRHDHHHLEVDDDDDDDDPSASTSDQSLPSISHDSSSDDTSSSRVHSTDGGGGGGGGGDSHAHGVSGGDEHHHSGPVATILNETAIIQHHGITPISYLYYDWVLTPSQVLEASLKASLGEVVVLDGLNKRHDGIDDEDDEQEQEQDLGNEDDEIATDKSNLHQHESAPHDDSLAHPTLILIHIISFTISFFFCLPLSLALKSAKVVYLRDDPRGVRVLHLPGAIKLLVDVGYWGGLIVGWASGTYYRSKTPELYKGHVHNLTGNMLLLVIIAISALDIISLVRRLISFTRLPSHYRDVESFNNIVLRGLGESTPKPRGARAKVATEANLPESHRLVDRQPREEDGGGGDDDDDEVDLLPSSTDYVDRNAHSQVIFETPWEGNDAVAQTGRHVRIRTDYPTIQGSRLSNASDSSTLRDSASPSGSIDLFEPTKRITKASDLAALDDDDLAMDDEQDPIRRPKQSTVEIARGFAKYFMIFINRAIVFWAFIVWVIGVCVYTGVGRGGYINGLAAHVIKGSIFFWYGILTFARYIGAFADYGWAWNTRPLTKRHSLAPSAEFVECFVIFLYGISNTWMERFGAAPGAPYSVKEVQHISIAVMFWFAGLIGMGMEVETLKKWLASAVVGTAKKGGRARAKELAKPPTYSASFNPFPALVIGVLGVAMSAHHQDYVFQVTIHALWGYLLAGFSLFRLLTYFFLYIAPPKESVMPTRPPTEALAAVSLACGGVVFVLSDEEITFSAMRHGWDDVMAFLNLTVALVCFLFCWVLAVLAAKGWAVQRRSDAMDDEQRVLEYDEHDESALEG